MPGSLFSAKRQRFIDMVKLLPWTGLAVLILDAVAIQPLFKWQGVNFNLEQSLVGIAAGLLVGLVCGLAGGVAFGVGCSVAGGAVSAAAVGAAVNIGFALAICLVAGSLAALALSALRDRIRSVPYGTLYGIATAIMCSAIFGLGLGLISGIHIGITFGLVYLILWLLFYYSRIIFYPFEAALSTLSYFWALQHPDSVARAWRWCPISWDEMVSLPLPFAHEMLALLLQQDSKEGLDRLSFILAERPRQHQVVESALTLAAVHQLDTQSLVEIGKVTDALEWITSEQVRLPSEIAPILPLFRQISQYVEQYQTLNKPYRKAIALAEAMKAIHQLEKILLATPGTITPRLRQHATQWLQLIEAEQKNLSSREVAEIPNPFYGGGEGIQEDAGNLFTGRQDIKQTLETYLLDVERPPILLLHGLRKMGKTSIINQLPRLLGPNFVTAIVDCQKGPLTTPQDIIRHVTRAMSRGLSRLAVPLPAVPPLTVDPYAALDEWIDTVARILPDQTRVMLCFDEYERLQVALDAGWGGQFLDYLRSISQQWSRITFIFVGAKTFAEQGKAWTQRFIAAQGIKVTYLQPEDVRLLLTNPIPAFPVVYEEGSIDDIITATNCHPFLTQTTAFYLVQWLNEQGRKTSTRADVGVAIGKTIDHSAAYFEDFWSDLDPDCQRLLHALAVEERAINLPDATNWLFSHDIINASGKIAVPMIARWIRQQKYSLRSI